MADVIPMPRPSYSLDVATTIRVEMARRMIRQNTVAQALGISQAAMSDRSRGKTPWTLDEVKLVADVLGVDVVELLRPRQDSNLQPTGWLAPVVRLARRAVAVSA